MFYMGFAARKGQASVFFFRFLSAPGCRGGPRSLIVGCLLPASRLRFDGWLTIDSGTAPFSLRRWSPASTPWKCSHCMKARLWVWWPRLEEISIQEIDGCSLMLRLVLAGSFVSFESVTTFTRREDGGYRSGGEMTAGPDGAFRSSEMTSLQPSPRVPLRFLDSTRGAV
ncbi:Uncharacterized protein Rs2_02165 [Raphanus sativus]|nr:Uncharacterized protein Rs2_02165 [Raphanus sativus]